MVPTFPMVPSAAIEPHLQPLWVCQEKSPGVFLPKGQLQTSPEFQMKELLSQGIGNIFSFHYSFRDEPSTQHHRQQFLMLEWYRFFPKDQSINYLSLWQESQELIEYCWLSLKQSKHLSPKIKDWICPTLPQAKKIHIRDLIKLYSPVEWNWEELLPKQFPPSIEDDLFYRKKIYTFLLQFFPDLFPSCHQDLPLWPWEDYFFLFFLNIIEPHLKNFDLLCVEEFPSPLCALSSFSPDDSRFCQRFEIYAKGVELANCFQECTDFEDIQRRYFFFQNQRKHLYQKNLVLPNILFEALQRGIENCGGIALGAERLLQYLCPFLQLSDPEFHRDGFWQLP